ncbi:MAG: creatininase family protein, partial [Sandaracinaceae bacterium]|nr:creatininase family protein [Sandaracinaceae bacterium]
MIRLFDLPHHDARSLLRSTDVPVFLTVNPVEFHGPHLSLHNDLHVSAGLNRDLHAALAGGRTDYPYVVAGELEIGVEPCSGPGSRHTRLQHARALVAEACRALVELGARKVVLGTFHG